MTYRAVVPVNYPYPDTRGPSYEFDVEEYDKARWVWRRSLSDADCRALAADYRMGKTTEENYDAYQEYLHRNIPGHDAAEKAKKPITRKRKRKT